MDPLLRSLKESGLGLSGNEFYVGGFIYANDIRTVVSSMKSLEAQVATVERFTAENLPKLNVLKCDVVVFGQGQTKTVVNSRDNERCGSALQHSESSSRTATQYSASRKGIC